MATRYATQQQGVADGTLIPPDKADAREVNGRVGVLIASKEDGVAWNDGDVVYLGRKPAGAKIVDVSVVTDTSLSTTTIDVGIGGDPRSGGTIVTADKYVDGATNTVTDRMVNIGPKAVTLDDTPPGEEHLWADINTTNIGADVIMSLVITYVRQ